MTVTFNSFASLEDRMQILGDMLDIKQEAEEWITGNKTATSEMWKHECMKSRVIIFLKNRIQISQHHSVYRCTLCR